MQRTMKRLGALFLALAMLVTFMPTLGLAESAHAEEEEEKGITVFLTVSDKGVIATDNEGEAMAWREVEVKDLDEDGKYTFHEALVAAHAKYNSADGYAGGSAGWVTSLWGDSEAGAYSFIRNNAPTDTVDVAEVKDGDYLVASVNQDNNLYSDWAAFFSSYKYVTDCDSGAWLSLYGFPAMSIDEPSVLEGIQIGEWKDGTFNEIEGEVTDYDGDVFVSFDEPGEHIVSAKGYVEDTASWVIDTEEVDKDGKAVYGRIDSSTLDYYAGYTEENHDDGPYPVDEIKWVNIDDSEFDWDDYKDVYFMHSNSILAPIIAPCCIVKVLPQPVEVSVTVNNKGILASDKDGEAMANRRITVEDEDEDCKITVDEALKAAHEECFKDGNEGYSAPGGWVSKLWGVETTNTLFTVNGNGIYSVADAELSDDDYIYASVNSDDKNYADFTADFDDTYYYAYRTEEITTCLMGHLGMAYTEEALKDKPLEGIQIGLWKDGEFIPIEGVVTDEDGKAAFSFKDEGEYLLTAKGTIRRMVDTDWDSIPDTEADCPIMAPYAFIEVFANEDAEAALPFKKALKDLPEADKLTLDDKAAVEKVRALYNALSEDTKEYVSDEELTDLKLAEITIEKLEAEDGKAKAEAAQKEAEDKLKKAQEDLKKAEEAARAAEEKAAKAEGDAKAVQDAAAKAQEDLKKAEETAKAAQAEADKAKASVADYDAKIAKLDDELKALKETIEVQQKTVKKVKGKAAKKKAKISWKKLGAGYKYEVFKGTKMNGKFKKAATAKKNKATVKKLKSKKTYFIKVRGFKMVGGKKVYTQFSDVIKVKAK